MTTPASSPWRLFVDTGGTFTDCLALDPENQLHRIKVLSSGVLIERTTTGETVHRATGLQAPILAAHLVTQTPLGAPLPPLTLRLGTTRGTNALLTHSGTPPALFVTEGFADLLVIGNQARPDLFALDIHKPEPLTATVVEVSERLAADGSVITPLDEGQVTAAARELLARGITTASVALLHSYRNPIHEERVAALLRDAGFAHVSVSSALAPFQKIVPRAETAVVNAYLTPVLESYLAGVRTGLSADSELLLMTSAGGLVREASFRPKDSLLSGPAGGVVGAAAAGSAAGFSALLTFDMGGTSTDVARIAGGAADIVFEHAVGDARLVAPAVAVETVAAGGGSLCGFDSHGRLFVGPASAGAAPGPACYGAGGPLTVTDVNLLLGRIARDDFALPLDIGAAETQADALLAQLGQTDRDALLLGLLELANEAMADAIRTISVRKGYDPTEHALVAFGGAGGQHACFVAEKLGVSTVIIPRDQSLLCAFGLGHAWQEQLAECQVLAPLAACDLPRLISALEDEAQAGLGSDAVIRRRLARVRLLGQDTPLDLPIDDPATLSEDFAARFAAIYGQRPDLSRTVELESLRVVAGVTPEPWPAPQTVSTTESTSRTQPVYFEGVWHETALIARETLTKETTIIGPALITEAYSVTVVPPGWQVECGASGALLLRKSAVSSVTKQEIAAPETVTLELFTRRFEAVATEMGEMLRRTALSVNVKERLDYSCALLGTSGELVATAAHIPVHLGALGACVRAVREYITESTKDTTHWVTNHPAFGGSHLPDVTVVTAVHWPRDNRLLGYVASRAHHSEIGGTRPGSTPPGATTLIEEGVVIPPVLYNSTALSQLLTTAPYPTRALADNLADLEAQVAANRRGAEALIALADTYGPETLRALQTALADRCERIVRSALWSVTSGTGIATLDDGARICVTLTPTNDTLHIDFTGTSPIHPTNFNAPPAVTAAAVLYVLRLLVGEELPLNEGILRAVTLHLPENTLVNPTFHEDPECCPAVVGGNTEVSQKIVAALLQAFQLSAGGQSTMNNVLFGNEHFGYYETVCGGAGATKNAAGASAVHTHMTNTRITDPEVLEARYPVQLERFAVRHGSGGLGKHRGGDGVIRIYRFHAPVALSLLCQSRTTGGAGMAGGCDGLPGRQKVIRTNGTVEELSGVAAIDLQPGDRLILETPGGGGYGAREKAIE